MSDRAAERTFAFGAFDVDMDPLPIAGTFGELVDPGLIDVDPVRGSEAVANEVFYIGEREQLLPCPVHDGPFSWLPA